MAKRYIALLRGINVGGNNIIKMIDLRACFEKMGFFNISTYIQSGNIAFDTEEPDQLIIERQITKHLKQSFNYEAPVVVICKDRLANIVKNAPKSFGMDQNYKYDVLFLKAPLNAKKAIKKISTRTGVDKADAGEGVLYFSRLAKEATKSHLTKIILLPLYKQLTIRNWNTTTKLINL